MTVLFAEVANAADVIHTVGDERWSEIAAELAARSAELVRRYSGILEKSTDDCLFALFGVPAALEDHALRGCMAALIMQHEIGRFNDRLQATDSTALLVRIGLNSGRVITGRFGPQAAGHSAVGGQIGLARRVSLTASTGTVMVSESTAKLVEHQVQLGPPETAGSDANPLTPRVRPLLGLSAGQAHHLDRRESTLVGRQWELSALTGMLDRSRNGRGCVAGVVGPPGIGKSRLIAETVAIAHSLHVEVFATFCESYASDIPYHCISPLMRAMFGIADTASEPARAAVRAALPDADPVDLELLDDMLGISESAEALPDIAPDARRRRVTALIIAAALARTTPRVLVIEDAHWIDRASEALLTDLLTMTVQTRAFVLITYRPEYQGPLSRIAGGQTIALGSLDADQTAQLITEWLGPDPSNTRLTAQITERAAGNPFFAEEIIRDLADRGILQGSRGALVCSSAVGDFDVPATLQAAIGARIDRLDARAKHTLNAASVIGQRFSAEVLISVCNDAPAVTKLIEAELVDQVKFEPNSEYAFAHPLIQAVAYQSQLHAERAELHRRLASTIQQRHAGTLDENAALIAEHLEAAGDLYEAFAWHMRAGSWATNRDILAARTSWDRARQVADQLPADDPARTGMRIAPRTLLCGSAWRLGDPVDTGFDELRQLASESDDKVSLAIGMAGQVTILVITGRFAEASPLASEFIQLVESIGDPTLTLALLYAGMAAKRSTGEAPEVQRVAQLCIDLAEGDVTKGNLIIGSPLTIAFTFRGSARCFLGIDGWKDDVRRAQRMVRDLDAHMKGWVLLYGPGLHIAGETLVSDDDVLHDTADLLRVAEQAGENFLLTLARFVRGVALIHRGDDHSRASGFELLDHAYDSSRADHRFKSFLLVIDTERAKEALRTGDVDTAITLTRDVVTRVYESGECAYRGTAVTAFVEALVARAGDADIAEAEHAISRLAAVPVEPGFVMNDVALARQNARLAQARGDETGFRTFADRYRQLAVSLGFEGHLAIADAMTSSAPDRTSLL